ncbi:MAG: DUF192 domain-containing protein [bacterium]|nr:DUF192 domain-containing protein [bacterium]
MRKYYKFFIVITLFFAVVILFFASYKPALAPENPESVFRELKINGKIINAEIADTPEKQVRGLSGRKNLSENQGMLFIFNTSDHHSFWMKDMNFSLDFIWISGDEIMEITRNVKPEDYQPASTSANRGEPPRSLISKSKVDKVLEVNAGVADSLSIKEGDKIKF